MSFHSVSRWVMRQMFSGMGGVIGSATRIGIYETLELLLSNQVLLSQALREIYLIESRDGKKKSDVKAVVLYECMQAIDSGKGLSDALAGWVPDQEVQLIRAGERSGDLVNALKDACRIIEAKKQIMGAVLGGTLYPILLGGMVTILLYQIAHNMVPQFARILPIEQWTGPAAVLAAIAYGVTNYGVQSLVGLFIFVIWMFWSMPYMNKSRVRNILDKIPPWSIYRMLHGTTFLLNVAVMLRAGIRLQEILIMMSKGGSPWLKTRVLGALHGINQGQNIGVALQNAGYEFPDPRAVRFLRILSDKDRFEEKLSNFANRWLGKGIADISSASKILLGLGVVTAGGLILLILAGVWSIQGLAQTAAQR